MSTASMRPGSYESFDDAPSLTRKLVRWGIPAVLLALLLLFFAWVFGWIRFGTDPRIAEIQKMQAEAQQQFMANGGPQTLEEAKAAVAAMGQIREKIDALPEGLQQQAGRRGGSMFRSMMYARINAYFSLPPDKRQAELDRQIKQEELFRKAWEASRPAGGGPAGVAAAGGGPGGAGGPGGTASGSAPASSGNTAGGGGPGGPPRSGNEEDRNRWRKNLIDSTTPEQRARYVEYRRAMEVRREQLGLQPGGPR
jgi:hypothetical protein